MDTSPEQCLPAKPVRGNLQYTAQDCKLLSENDRQGNGQPLGVSFLIEVVRKFRQGTCGTSGGQNTNIQGVFIDVCSLQ